MTTRSERLRALLKYDEDSTLNAAIIDADAFDAGAEYQHAKTRAVFEALVQCCETLEDVIYGEPKDFATTYPYAEGLLASIDKILGGEGM